MKLVFATNNQHKLDEVQKITAGHTEIVSLAAIDCHDDIPETADTLEGNALQKARYIKDKFGYDCFADDTGLEVEALNNAPGVYSARYAGPAKDSVENMKKVLREMEGISDRKACFRTVIALIQGKEEQLFEGRVDGKILTAQQGEAGFGYDPIFQPEGFDLSFAEMPMDEKNKISHRGRAIQQLIAFLKEQHNK